MGNLWLKIKVWTKIVIFSAAFLYLLIFIVKNDDQKITVWVWYHEAVPTTGLRLIVCMFLAGVVGTLLFRMAFRTVRQIRELLQRSQTAQMHKDAADMVAKAAKLQTKADSSANPPGGPPTT